MPGEARQDDDGTLLPRLTDMATLPFEIDGKKFVGTATVDRKSSLGFQFNLPAGTLQFTVASCHRELYIAKPLASIVKMPYSPVMFLENLRSCFVTATAITRNGETHVGLIELRQGLEETLPATSKCNGETVNAVGAHLCQANGKAGLIQRIEFESDVVYSELTPGCSKLEVAPVGVAYEYRMSPGFCVYKFMDKQKRKFRLTTFGYSTISDAKPEVRQ